MKITILTVFFTLMILTENSFSQTGNYLIVNDCNCNSIVLTHDGGMFGNTMDGDPNTRFHVSSSSSDSSCPPKNSIINLKAHVYGTLEGTINNGIFTVTKPATKAQDIKIRTIIPCSGVGHVGSGTPNLCCEGLDEKNMFDVNCQILKGGYVCVECGDGICDDSLENNCNCPEDCPQ